ncbi:MAG TPA: hypothetical protein VLT86_08100 [Vicinamibacterales bacterium]|nr:hypothetical protein [Vicinamibacterales bacterium]
MRKPLLVTLGLFLMMGTLIAQTHDNATEKKVTDVVVFTTDVRVGTTILKAGEYKVACDTKTVTFTRLVSGKDQEWVTGLDPVEQLMVKSPAKVLEMPCKGKQLSANSENTVAEIGLDKDGVQTLKTLRLRGSNVEHVFN